MCGIAGIFTPNPPQAENAIRAMNNAQKHRGPDDEGFQFFTLPRGTLALGHRRLSILDLSTAGHQPMQNPTTGDWIVFNGEIYNYLELRKEFEARGIHFRSHCDTEVILHAFAQWGTECFKRLYGMFAIAIYEHAKKRLILARDPLGIKPLYYAFGKNAFLFASELRTITVTNSVSQTLDRRALAGLLAYGAIPGPLTVYKEIQLLDPGTYAVLDLTLATNDQNSFQPIRYWNFPALQQSPPSRKAAIEQIYTLLKSAVQSHLQSDVPVGLFLSGGLDSTAIVALCNEIAPATINTFTISLADRPTCNEAIIAEQTARLFGAKHHILTLSDSEIRGQTQRWLEHLDQPSVDGLNTYIISQVVRKQGIKVALSGLGGDEIFGGYSSFRNVVRLARWLPKIQWLPSSLRAKLAILPFLNKSKAQRQKARELATTSPSLLHLYFRSRRLFSDLEIRQLGFDLEALSLNEDYLPFETDPERGMFGDDLISAISILESRFYMGNMLLRDADVFSMAHGLEIRVPFLDQRLVDYVMSLPGNWRIGQNGHNKPLLVEALSHHPRLKEIQRIPKRGFSLSQAKWMTGPLREQFEYFLETLKQSGWVEPATVAKVWQDFLADTQGPSWSRAWMLGVLGAWLKPGG